MGFLSRFINKKKSDDTDGQEQYFKEDFDPRAGKQKPKGADAEPKAVKTENSTAKPTKKDEKPVAKSSPAKPVAKSTSAKPAAKSASAKPTTKSASAKPAAKSASAKPQKTGELSDDSPEVKGAVAVSESKETANGKWDIRRAKDGRFFFSLYASNHTVIAYSQIYSSITAVNTGINSVITNAAKSATEDTTLKNPASIPCPKWEIYIDRAEQYRFRLYAPNGLVICHSSHGYSTKSGCKGGIESIKRFAAEAKVDKSYLK